MSPSEFTPMVEDKVQQVIVIRRDLKGIPKGKLEAQAAHAGRGFIIDAARQCQQNTERAILEETDPLKEPSLENIFSLEEWCWLLGDRVTIVLGCDDEDCMMDVLRRAKEAGIRTHLVTDIGLTCFDKPTNTAIALGPARKSKLDLITKDGPIKLTLR